MGQDMKNRSRVCPLPPGPLKDAPKHMRPRIILMAVSLTFILTTSLMYYLMLPPPLPPAPLQLTPHAAIAIDGDANFYATALLEGWPGDGSPENPYIIDGLDIDFVGEVGNCISISNTRVSFTISNCYLTGAKGAGSMSAYLWGAGIWISNVKNGDIVNNTCSSNGKGIFLHESDSNIVSDNICYNNTGEHAVGGIFLTKSDSNIVSDNICYNNSGAGINLDESSYNTVVNNTCSSNQHQGICLYSSESNTVANNICYKNTLDGLSSGILLIFSHSNSVVNNTCNRNDIGIHLHRSDYNDVLNNTCLDNIEHDILEEPETKEFDPAGFQFVGFAGVIMLGAGWRMVNLFRVESRGE